ncbi:hypothetical protein FA95DRAFT_1584328 [Auriscalpium vulgare]|uniref:Uncharacterized protein n=1 Tax=Auriscalpium vulgare TaxID=40419 RepID=A0ACB8RFU7_9AGAM|nr:hypothetical protein FA95DRAFT_1584328 [Auriscalpium vulgare]
MDHLDTSWCPVCSRQILPKRYLAPPRQTRRGGTIRAKGGGGLVRGTGRVKPNGAIKRSDSKKDLPPAQPAPAPAAAPAPLKHRTVIDQAPTPLYCSDECRLADLEYIHSGYHLDYNPARDPRDSPPLPPVPHNSFSAVAGISPLSSGSSSDVPSSPGSSPDSQGSTLAGDAPTYFDSPLMTPSVRALARIYDFPPLPPPPPLLTPEEPAAPFDTDYQSGVMMAARRIKDALCPAPAAQQQHQRTIRAASQPGSRERKPIPGWTDGSDAWRANVYSLASPSSDAAPGAPPAPERPSPYGSFVASPHRAGGVYSTLGDPETDTPTGSAARAPPARANTAEELYSKYPLSFSRRSDSRTSLSSAGSSVPHPHSLPVPARRREHGLLKKGAEGKLLVPDVKMRSGSASSYQSEASSWRSASTRSLARSPLSRYGSEASVESAAQSIDGVLGESRSRPAVETRSWSYDNVMTYPAMPMPVRKETRYEKRVVDGITTVVETEVEVQPQMKRLFLFPGKETRVR